MVRRGAPRRKTGPRGVGRGRAVVAVALATSLTLAACGGGDGGGGIGSIRVLDYYNNEPDRTDYQALEACGQQAGVAIERETVPGESLIARVLQQASSRTLPDVLMLDNPDLQQIAATGALAPISDFGLSADGYAEGVVSASTLQRPDLRAPAGRQHDRSVLQPGHAGPGRRHPAHDMG